MARMKYSKAGLALQAKQPSHTHFKTREQAYSTWQGRHKPSYNPPTQMSIPAIKRRWARYTLSLAGIQGKTRPVKELPHITRFFLSDTPPPRAGLHTLAQEILEQIAAPLDRRTVLSLQRTSRAFHRRLESVLWRHFDISLHPHFGIHPIIIGNDNFWSDRGRARPYRQSYPGVDVDESIKAHFSKVLRTIISQHNAGKRAHIRSLRVAICDQVLHQQVDLIKDVAPTLQSLELVSYGDRKPESCFDTVFLNLYDLENRTDKPNITLEMLGQPTAYFGLLFPRLTTVILHAGAVCFAEFIILLLRMAPNVEHLEFEAGDYGDAKGFKDRLEDRGISLHTTKIRHLRLSLSDRYFAGSYTPVLALLENSPLVERLSLDYQEYSVAGLKRARALVAQMQHLEDLHWRMDWKIQGVAEPALPSLRRLAMPLSELYPSAADFSSPCPKLEFAIFNRSHPHSHRDRHVSEWTTLYPSVQPLPTDFALWLRAYPLLHSISFVSKPTADLLLDPTPTVKIHSIRHGDQEVLHVKMLSTVRRWGGVARWSAVEDSWRSEEEGVEKHEPVWVECTDYENDVVPLHVLEEMRRVEGANEDWEKRGVEVGKKAWQVLLDWQGSGGG